MNHLIYWSKNIDYRIIDEICFINIQQLHTTLKASENFDFLLSKVSPKNKVEFDDQWWVMEHGIAEYFNYADSICYYDKYEFMKVYYREFPRIPNLATKRGSVNPRFFDYFEPCPDSSFTRLTLKEYYWTFATELFFERECNFTKLHEQFTDYMEKKYPLQFSITKVSYSVVYYHGLKFIPPKRATIQ